MSLLHDSCPLVVFKTLMVIMSYLGNDLENEQSRERSHAPCESKFETGNEEPLN